MATTKVTSVIDRAQILLQDVTGVRWPNTELLLWLNDAQLAIVNKRPDAHTKRVPFAAAQNTLQQLPADGLRLIKVVRNGTTGPVIRPIQGEILDDQLPNWHSADKPVSRVDHYIYDPREPKAFYLYPCPVAGHQVELVYAVAPAAIELTDFENAQDPITLDDSYVNALVDFIVYRALSKETQYANRQIAQMHYNAFLQALGEKVSSDAAITPTPTTGIAIA